MQKYKKKITCTNILIIYLHICKKSSNFAPKFMYYDL